MRYVRMKLWIRWFLGLTLIAMIVVVYPLSQVPSHVRHGALLGWSVSLLISGSSGALAFWSLDHSQRVFLLVTFGGMLARLAIVTVAVGVAILVLHVHVGSFLVGLLGAYTVYQALELFMLYRRRSPGSAARNTPVATGSSGEMA